MARAEDDPPRPEGTGPDRPPDTGTRRSDTRARIQTAATELFLTAGIERTSLREIADQLGITKAALYYHFRSKEALVRSLVEPFTDAVEALLAEAETGDGVAPHQFLAAYFDLVAEHRRLFQLLLRDVSAFVHLGLVEQMLGWQVRARHLLLGPDPTPDREIRAVVALGGLQDVAALAPAEIPLEEARPVALDAALAALGKTHPAPSPTRRGPATPPAS